MKSYLRMFSALWLLAAVALTAAAAPADAITVKASVDSVELVMGDRAKLNVQVEMPSSLASSVQLVDFPILSPGTEYIDFHGVDVVASDSTVTNANGRTRLDFDFTIQAFDPGAITIPPFAVVAAQGADTVRSGIVALKVIPVDVDSLETINPMESIVAPQTRWYDYFPDWLLWTLLAVVVAVAGTWAYLKFRRHRVIVEERRQAPVPPYDLAMTRLSTLRSRNLAENGHEKEYYTELVDILREYLQGRFGINAMEMTSGEILELIRKQQEATSVYEGLKQIMQLADFVKFAKMHPLPDENDLSMMNAYLFVNQTKVEVVAEPETDSPSPQDGGHRSDETTPTCSIERRPSSHLNDAHRLDETQTDTTNDSNLRKE